MKDPDSPTAETPATPAHTVEETGEYWSRKLQGDSFTPELYWRRVPEVERRRIRLETGGGDYSDWTEYCVREFLAGRTPVDRMLSVGCGTGTLERQLARLGAFKDCDAWDVSVWAVDAARQLAREEGLDNIHYDVRDITAVDLEPDSYDAIWFENVLHHIEPLEEVCEKLARALKPDGYLFLNEYIGPSRFAFPPRQRELIRAAFALIPARYRLHREAGTTLTSAALPTPAEVEADDPTESVRSADIPAVVESWFDVVAFHESGGSLLQFLLNGIAGNFRDDDPESQRVIDMLLRLEDDLLEIGEMRSDFAVIVARPRRPVAPRPVALPAPPALDAGEAPPPVLLTLEEELAHKRTLLDEAESYARSLEQEIAKRDAQIQEVSGYASSLEEEIRRKQSYESELETYALSLRNEVEGKQSHKAKLEAYARSLLGEVARKQSHTTELEVYAQSLAGEVARKQSHTSELEVYAQSLEEEVARKQSELDRLQAETARKQAELDQLRAETAWHHRPRIHTVIVHHRGRELLELCLRRLLASRGVDLQVVIVSNACREPMPEIAEGHERVHLVRSDASLGFSAANNLGVDWARRVLGEPDHWFFLNNDAGVEPGTLGRLSEALGSVPRAGVAGPRLVIWGAEDHLNSLGLNVTAIGEAWDEGIGVSLADYGEIPSQREVLAVTGSALLVSAEALREIGGWNDLYGYYFEDIDLCLQARQHGWKVIHVPDAVAAHAISATADQITDFKRLLSWRNQVVLMLRHWPAGHLLRATPRLVGGQLRKFIHLIRVKDYADARLQARAWGGALRLLPRALVQRLHKGGDSSWTRFLRPAGTVPVIRLPPILPGRRPWERPADPPQENAGPERSSS